jgi:hypothetical protein
LKEDLLQEKNSLKNALNKEFGWFESEEEKQKLKTENNDKLAAEIGESNTTKQEEGEFIIEWDE